MKSKPTFLLIEDNLIDQLVTTELIKRVLCITEVIITNNGEEGIQWLNNHTNLHQSLIILLDIQMPIMNGFEFLKEYDKLNGEFKKEIQIYVLSSTLDHEEIKKIKDNNYVTELLSKPLPIEEFRQKIHLNNTNTFSTNLI